MEFLQLPSPLQCIDTNYQKKDIELYIKRDELIHPLINGNKWRKLSLNIQSGLNKNISTILSFGGAFSNHLVAIASLAKQLNLKSTGIIRTHKPDENNPTIQLLRALGMGVIFKSPAEYREEKYLNISAGYSQKNEKVLIVPEGGTNAKGVEGAMEIMKEVAKQSAVKFDFIVVSVGTGGTLAGISKSSPKDSKIYAMSPFKSEITQIAGHEWLERECVHIEWINVSEKSKFGSYQSGVSDYINQFYNNYDILLEPIYTARAMRGLDKSIMNGDIAHGSKVLFIHTGGLQGIMGYNYLHRDKDRIAIPKDYDWLTNPLTTFG